MKGKELKENITQYFVPKVSYDAFYQAVVSKMVAIVDRKVRFNSKGANKLDEVWTWHNPNWTQFTFSSESG